jgi:hypothetical protein
MPSHTVGLTQRGRTMTTAILYEHPEWFRPLFAALDRRGVEFEPIDMTSHRFDPTDDAGSHELVVNRMSPSAGTRGNGRAVTHTLHYLEHLEALGVPVMNGVEAFRNELSKVAQLRTIGRLGLAHPRAVAINHPEQASKAAADLAFPVLVKPNVGGSGAGIRSFPTLSELEDASSALDLGPDGTALVQEYLPARGEQIVRVEVVGGRFLYAIRILLEPGTFNLCPADYCRVPDADAGAVVDDAFTDGVSGRGLPIEAYTPPSEIVAQVEAIVAASGMEVGGVEYLVSDRDGEAYFYDVNALSNFVADADRILGFDPYDDLAAHIAGRLGA